MPSGRFASGAPPRRASCQLALREGRRCFPFPSAPAPASLDTMRRYHFLVVALSLAGCTPDPAEPPQNPAPPAAKPAEAKKVPAGQNVWVEIQGDRRRVGVQAKVCLREGQLEQVLCRKHTMEHEAILAADTDARDLHKALLVTGAQPGTPVRFLPKFEPPKGSRIRVTLQYEDKGKLVTVPA